MQHADFYVAAATLSPIFLLTTVLAVRGAVSRVTGRWRNTLATLSVVMPANFVILGSLYALASDQDTARLRIGVYGFTVVQVVCALGSFIVALSNPQKPIS